MKKLILITGGARSGKSRMAVKKAKKSRLSPIYLATCEALDDEMRKRIKLHKKSRPKWPTIEEPIKIADCLKKRKSKEIVLIDCLTIWVSNLYSKPLKEKAILSQVNCLAKALKSTKASVILVSNEVGSSIVPENKLARDFRDTLGLVNQKIAQTCDEVYFAVSGLPLRLK